MRRLSPLLLVLLLAGCDAASGGQDGPLALGIVAGNHQTVTAGAEKLPDPVTAKVVRKPGGGITLRLVTPAYAEGTVVSGSPVPGAVVCAVSITEDAMEPFTPCTNTDEQGQATFFFTPPTKVGTPMSEIRGTVEGEPAVFDTASATVVAGPMAKTAFDSGPWQRGSSPDSLVTLSQDPSHPILQDAYGNLIPFRVQASGWLRDTVAVLDANGNTAPALGIAHGATPQEGDTASVTFVSADSAATVLVRTTATLDVWMSAKGWIISFTRQ